MTAQWVQSFILGVTKCLGTRERRRLNNIVNVLNTNESITLKKLILLCEFHFN